AVGLELDERLDLLVEVILVPARHGDDVPAAHKRRLRLLLRLRHRPPSRRPLRRWTGRWPQLLVAPVPGAILPPPAARLSRLTRLVEPCAAYMNARYGVVTGWAEIDRRIWARETNGGRLAEQLSSVEELAGD